MIRHAHEAALLLRDAIGDVETKLVTERPPAHAVLEILGYPDSYADCPQYPVDRANNSHLADGRIACCLSHLIEEPEGLEKVQKRQEEKAAVEVSLLLSIAWGVKPTEHANTDLGDFELLLGRHLFHVHDRRSVRRRESAR